MMIGSGCCAGLGRPGESVTLPMTFTIDRPAVYGARIVAADGEMRLFLDVPVYPAAPAFADYQIADGLTVPPYSRPLGEGNRDGHAAPGESFAVPPSVARSLYLRLNAKTGIFDDVTSKQ